MPEMPEETPPELQPESTASNSMGKSKKRSKKPKNKSIPIRSPPPDPSPSVASTSRPLSGLTFKLTRRTLPDTGAQPIQPSGSKSSIQKNLKEKPLKSHAELPERIKDVDLQTAITEDLFNGSYECMICLHTLGKSAQIWACQTCYGLFHLSCVKKWAESCLKTESDGRQTWRCPGCQGSSTDPIPDSYYCFCGKTLDPQYSKVGIPHSCSQPCSKPRSCPHRCSDPCHPGPCKPCSAMTPPTLCHCGKESFVVKCSSLSSPLGSISCGRVCNKKLNCGVHYCQADCHPGQCSPCQSKVSMTCSCGNSTTELICGDPKTKEPFRCQRVCGLTFSCKAHTCEEVCHSHPPDPVPCPTDPLIVTHCPCGKTPVESLTVKRTSCQDRIVTCTKTCGKLLPCGHACLSVCHVGSCSPCRQPLEMDCRCGKQRIRSLCHAINKDDFGSPLCSNPCQQKMHCKRHRCGDLCCVKEIHICEKTCSKPLSCGLHTCLQPCGHPQRCHDCVEGVSFEERVCACGRTKMMPPIPCNTPPIICSYPCRRVRPCGHRQLTEHKCHSDSVSCPPCMAFARRECNCGRSFRTDVPCSRQIKPNCGQPCEGTLNSCKHPCRQYCHEGPCDTVKCKSPCGRTRSLCGHKCGYPCHGTVICPEDQVCRAPFSETCPCGHRKVTTICGMKKSETDDDGLFSRKGVECDAECARLERNRVLAEALQIEDPEDVIVSTVYDEDLLAFATEFPGWTSDIQSVISTFVHDRDQKHYYFPTKFRPAQNQFLIALSPVYNLFAELVDAGTGKGNVIYRKQGQEPRLPSRLLSEAVLARTHGEPESLEVMESSQDSLPDADVSGQVVNALIFFNLQLGLDPLVICSLVQAMVSLDIQLKPHSIESTTHCAIQFIPQSEVYKPPNALEMLIKESVLGPIRKRLVEIDRLVNDVQTCRITPTDEIIFKGKKRRAFRQQFASTSRGDSGVVSGRNPFSYLDESQ